MKISIHYFNNNKNTKVLKSSFNTSIKLNLALFIFTIVYIKIST